MTNKYSKIGIVGAGAWGSALASAFARSIPKVILWAREEELIDQINQHHQNKLFLEGITLPKNIRATNNFSDLEQAEVILMVAPAQFTRNVLNNLVNEASIDPNTPIIFCSKGIENNTCNLLSEIAQQVIPNYKIGILSGPSFADEVAKNLPASLNIATEYQEIKDRLIESAKDSNLSLYPIDDIIGAQIAGALKNVYAIGCGIAKGLELGNNFHSALITMALKEMQMLTDALHGNTNTMYELCGIGDTTLTCSSEQSRNFSFGWKIGKGADPKEILGQGSKVIEGAATAISVNMLCKELGLELPICQILYGIIYNNLDAGSLRQYLQ